MDSDNIYLWICLLLEGGTKGGTTTLRETRFLLTCSLWLPFYHSYQLYKSHLIQNLQYLPRLLLTVVFEQLSTMSLSRGNFNDLDNTSSTLFDCQSGLVSPKVDRSTVTDICLNPTFESSNISETIPVSD